MGRTLRSYRRHSAPWRRQAFRPVLPAVLHLFALALFVAPSIAAQPSGKVAPSIPAQLSGKQVAREQALAKINEHIGRIDLALREMLGRYDYDTAPSTLIRAFQDKGVKSPTVLGYATPWGQNAVFLAWRDVKPYYDYHRQALVESANSIRASRATSVPIEDLGYLDLSMNAWLQHEKSVQGLLQQLIALRAGAASFMDNKQAVNEEREKQPYSAQGPYDQRIAALEAQAKQQLDQAAERAKRLDDIGDKLRLFSPITAKSRIAPPDMAVADNAKELAEKASKLRQLAEKAKQGGPKYWDAQAKQHRDLAKKYGQTSRPWLIEPEEQKAKEAEDIADELRNRKVPEKPDPSMKDKKKLAELEKAHSDALERMHKEWRALIDKASDTL